MLYKAILQISMIPLLVSVIIPNYNYAKYLREAIDSVLAQTYRNIEIIVVDDGSKDDSKKILESYGEKITAIFQANQGVSAARNNGVAASKGEYVAFLDADDIWLARKIELQIEKFVNDKTLGLVHVGVEDIDAQGKVIGTHLNGLTGEVSHELLRFKLSVILGGGSGIMIPRKILDEIGGFDLRLSTSADWDFFYRISSRYQIGFIDDLLLKYRIHVSNMHGNVEQMEREMMLSFEKAFTGETSVNHRECYGNLHKVLAGSYFHAKQYKKFIRQAMKSIWMKPSNFGHFAQFPLRHLQKK
jgi:glycosyltransferase involved in cell wall biosynthesis